MRPTPPAFRLTLPTLLLLTACSSLPLEAAGLQPTPPPPAFTTASPVQEQGGAATSIPTLTASPFPPLTPTLTPTPAPSLVRLTEPGCCVQPFWSPDGTRIFFIDKPSADAPAGLYAVDPSRPGSVPEFFSSRPGLYSSDMSHIVYPERGLAVVESLLTGERWEVNTSGNAPAFSPDATRMLWHVGGGGGPTNSRRSDLYVANVDGSEARFVTSFVGGSAQAWFPDSARVLVVSRPSLDSLERALAVLDLSDGGMLPLARAERIGSVRLSPGGSWAAFVITFSANPAEDGLWLARTEGGELKRLDLYGAYHWRDDGRLLVISLELGRGSHVLWEVEAATGQARRLTDPAQAPFTVANGDWSVAPDGSRIVFVGAADRALWLLQLP